MIFILVLVFVIVANCHHITNAYTASELSLRNIYVEKIYSGINEEIDMLETHIADRYENIIFNVDIIIVSTLERNSIPLSGVFISPSIIILKRSPYIIKTFDHEISHFIEYRTDSSFIDKWDELNEFGYFPEGKETRAGFVSQYAMTNGKEDRAETFTSIMHGGHQSHPIITKKIRLMYEILYSYNREFKSVIQKIRANGHYALPTFSPKETKISLRFGYSYGCSRDDHYLVFRNVDQTYAENKDIIDGTPMEPIFKLFPKSVCRSSACSGSRQCDKRRGDTPGSFTSLSWILYLLSVCNENNVSVRIKVVAFRNNANRYKPMFSSAVIEFDWSAYTQNTDEKGVVLI